MTARFGQTDKRKTSAGFTLVEAMTAVGIMVILVAACLSAIVFDQISVRKAKEEAIVMNFLTHYVEMIKALKFTEVVPDHAINSYFNGVSPAVLITIPHDNSWVSLNTTAFQNFDPDLGTWLSNRNPAMQVTLTPHYAGGGVGGNGPGGVLHDIEINVKVDWDAPLAKGGRLEVQTDFLRTKDVPTL